MNAKCNDKYSQEPLKKNIFKKLLKRSPGLLIVVLIIAGQTISKNIFANTVKAQQLNPLTKKSFVSTAVGRSGTAVVTLETQRRVFSRQNSALPPGLLLDPYLERLFGLQGTNVPRTRIERGQGSGVIFSSDGLVLTNAHVIEKSDRLMIGMSDGRRVPGRVLGLDSLTDLAVIQLEGLGPWPTAPLGDSDKLVVGDWAIAVGNPYGLENTVTLGIISNLNRNVAQLGISGKRLNLIQTDAAINPGNSGGPLLNAEGEVIGINTLVRSGPGAGLGFAIPINLARQIAQQIIENGSASHPMIGVSLSAVPMGQTTKDTNKVGALIRYIIPGAPAAIGGLRIGDIIIAVGKIKIKEPKDVIHQINKNGSDKALNITIKRGEKVKILSITPIEMNALKNL